MGNVFGADELYEGPDGQTVPLKCIQKKDLERPKRPMSPYNYFVKSRMTDRRGRRKGFDFSQGMGDFKNEWKTMSDEDKAPYMQAAAEDRKRFNQEKAKYENDKSKIIKRPLNGYMVFMQDFRYTQKGNYKNPKELVREGAKAWQKLSKEEKEPYNRNSLSDSDRYAKERFRYCNKIVFPRKDDTRFGEDGAESFDGDHEPSEMDINDEKEMKEWLMQTNAMPSSSTATADVKQGGSGQPQEAKGGSGQPQKAKGRSRQP